FFKISKAEVGDTLVVSMLGFETVGWVFNGESYVDIPLKAGVELASAEVVEKKASTQLSLLSPLDVQSLNRKELVKAACCNLSEAFETNASVDASFTDAVTGTRQIRMLGLDGKYSQIQVDNLPGPRGLSVVKGLMFIPGDWVNQIHISKGAGTATQGYESITGQINVALKNPETADPLHTNLYVNSAGRLEFNSVSSHQVSRRWRTAVLLHGLTNEQQNDRNSDGFLDTPMQKHYVVRNEWKFTGDRGIRGEYALTAVQTESAAGQMAAIDQGAAWSDVMGLMNASTNAWSAITTVDRVEATAKTGYVFPDAEWRSIGTQWSYYNHRQTQRFGSNYYDGHERFFRGNILYAGIIGNTNHSFTTGLSYVYNAFDEQLQFQVNDSMNVEYGVDREEQVPGVFAEYTWSGNERWSVIGGVRYDQHNMFGGMLSPRLHARWSVTENVSWKLAAGRGFRTPNPFMEQLGTWASQRQWYWGYDSKGLQPEIATNLGTNLTSKFRLNYREATLTLDAYSTRFENKLVVDLDQATNAIHLYNLSGASFANTAQVEFNWDMHRRWDVRLAYRWVNAHTDRILGNPTEDPFVSKHRGFSQLSYAS
ncbi:MAG: TonB-dependent receptor plug domain-containing protein, partial [Flavobacteriales bacterium]